MPPVTGSLRGWNGTISTFDDVGFQGRGEGGPMCGWMAC